MNTSSPFSPTASGTGALHPGSGRAEFGQAAISATSMRWAALHDAAAVVSQLAGLAPEPIRPEIRNFPAIVRDLSGWRRQLAEEGVEDLAVLMEPGLAALLAVNARGINCAVPALALWQEFHAARAGLLALIPPSANQARRLG